MARFQVRQLPEVEEDGLPIMDVHAHAEEKYRLVWAYDVIFTSGMKAKWDELVYLDLYAGPGYSRIEGGKIVYGSPLLAMNIPDPFSRYIFCERDPVSHRTLFDRVQREPLAGRATCIEGDANEEITTILDQLPRPSSRRTMLTFCFVDPHKIGDFRFDSIAQLAQARYMDFLVLIPTGMDIKRAMTAYERSESDRIEVWMGVPEWREEWSEAKKGGEKLNHFLVRRFAEQMRDLGLGYELTKPAATFPIYHTDRRFPLYHLAFFTRHSRGEDFWKKAKRAGGSDQRELDLG